MLLMSIAGMMGIVNLGLGEATLRYVSMYYSKNDIKGINRVIGSTFFVYTFMGIIGGSLLFLFADNITNWFAIKAIDRELTISIIKLTAFNFGFSFIIGVYSVIPHAILRFDISTKISIIQNIFQVFGTVIFLILGYGLYYIVLWSVVSIFFTQVTNMLIAKKLLPDITLIPSFSKEGLKEVFSYGVFSSINDVISLLSSHIDRVLLAAFVNPTAVAALAVPRQILERASSLTQSAGSVLFPKISTMEDVASIRNIYQLSSLALLTFTMALFAPGIILLPSFLSVWISPEFAKTSGLVAQLLAASFAFRGISEPYFAVLKGTNNIKKLSIIFFMTSFIGVIIALPMLYYYGLVGAGIRSLFLVWLSIPVSLWVNKKILKESSSKDFLNLILIVILLTTVVVLIGGIFNHYIPVTSLIGVLVFWLILSLFVVIGYYLIVKYVYKMYKLEINLIESKIKSQMNLLLSYVKV